MDMSAVLAIYAAIVSTILLLIKVVEFGRSGPDLQLSISRAAAIGGMVPTDDILQVTAANQGGSRIGVSSLNLSLANGKAIPLIDHLPITGSKPLAAILEPHERSVMWLDYQDLARMMREQRTGIVAVIAFLNDGSQIRRSVPAEWRSFDE